MQQTRAVELGTGLFVFMGILALFFLTTRVTTFDAYAGDQGYELQARFDQVGTLKVRSPVSISGVQIGRVTAIEFDSERLEAVVTMRIGAEYDQIPNDSDASILTAGILGGQYIGLQPGGAEEYFADGDEILFTQSAVVLEQLISKYLFSQAGGDE
ncbi:outer membrane lipid asymmetry maintenance protein MlaD [Thioalkalivibrio sp. XN279]|uniref:outer membrane lipid asymmetry maintenance protein MlaD n=1 Tax=Thioalkalivibrio sp. XN279 TaxID=2714953 RepID=UPI00140D737B|nr:outer membrane lipid asymmetry maintenance protein MlaD [Thioalkalivibrio sp. XN279]NHA14723.1 outer membrane lipid asymmetry maintenance protein MlaD [Thioalkalivibrio sp. XN279]